MGSVQLCTGQVVAWWQVSIVLCTLMRALELRECDNSNLRNSEAGEDSFIWRGELCCGCMLQLFLASICELMRKFLALFPFSPFLLADEKHINIASIFWVKKLRVMVELNELQRFPVFMRGCWIPFWYFRTTDVGRDFWRSLDPPIQARASRRGNYVCFVCLFVFAVLVKCHWRVLDQCK